MVYFILKTILIGIISFITLSIISYLIHKKELRHLQNCIEQKSIIEFIQNNKITMGTLHNSAFPYDDDKYVNKYAYIIKNDPVMNEMFNRENKDENYYG